MDKVVELVVGGSVINRATPSSFTIDRAKFPVFKYLQVKW